MIICVTAEHDLWYVDLPDSDADFVVKIGKEFGSLCHAVSFLKPSEAWMDAHSPKQKPLWTKYQPDLERITQLTDYVCNVKNYVKGPPSVVYYE